MSKYYYIRKDILCSIFEDVKINYRKDIIDIVGIIENYIENVNNIYNIYNNKKINEYTPLYQYTKEKKIMYNQLKYQSLSIVNFMYKQSYIKKLFMDTYLYIYDSTPFMNIDKDIVDKENSHIISARHLNLKIDEKNYISNVKSITYLSEYEIIGLKNLDNLMYLNLWNTSIKTINIPYSVCFLKICITKKVITNKDMYIIPNNVEYLIVKIDMDLRDKNIEFENIDKILFTKQKHYKYLQISDYFINFLYNKKDIIIDNLEIEILNIKDIIKPKYVKNMICKCLYPYIDLFVELDNNYNENIDIIIIYDFFSSKYKLKNYELVYDGIDNFLFSDNLTKDVLIYKKYR